MTTPAPPQAILPTHQVLSACLVMGEPSLDDLLTEPIVLLTMKRDGVSVPELRALCEQVREWLNAASVEP